MKKLSLWQFIAIGVALYVLIGGLLKGLGII